MNAYCHEKSFFKWFETSPKDNINIETSVRSLIDEILKQKERLKSAERNIVRLADPVANTDENKKSRNSCCSGQ